MSRVEKTIRFSRAKPESVVAAMQSLGEVGEGWINIRPLLPDETLAKVPVRSGMGAWFAGRGPHVPMATWMPATDAGRRPTAAQIGVEHGAGPNALKRLTGVGHPLPEGWLPRQDHAKHGIVVELPDGVDGTAVVDWMISAITELSELVQVGDRWHAVVHRSS